jgi:hypothetical protein
VWLAGEHFVCDTSITQRQHIADTSAQLACFEEGRNRLEAPR